MEVDDESKGNSSESLGMAKKSDDTDSFGKQERNILDVAAREHTDSFGKQEMNMQDDAGPEHKVEITDKVGAVLSAPAVCSNVVTMASGSDAADEADAKFPSEENMEIERQSTKEPMEPACRLNCNSPPVSLSTVCDAAENSTVPNSEGTPTVAEVQRTLQILDDALPEAVIEEGGSQGELRPSPLQKDSLQNSTEKSSTPYSDSLPAPSTDESHTLSRTVSDAEATKLDSDRNPQNEEDAKNEFCAASESDDSGNQVRTRGDEYTCEVNVQGNTEVTCVEPILENSAEMPQLLAPADDEMEVCQDSVPSATSNGTSESLISSSPDLNQQTNPVEAESGETPETISDTVVAEAKPTAVQPDDDGSSNSDDPHKPNAADSGQVKLVLDSVLTDPYQNRAEVTVAEAEPTVAQPDDGASNSDDSHKSNAADSGKVELVLDSVPIDQYQNGAAEVTVPSSDHPDEKAI